MFCVECGQRIEPGTNVCPECGKPVNQTPGGEPKRDYTSEGKEMFKKMQSGSFWITGMRIFAWIFAGLIVLSGFISFVAMTVSYYGNGLVGFLTFLSSVVVAFLCVAGMMIFLDLARDVSEIKAELRKEVK